MTFGRQVHHQVGICRLHRFTFTEMNAYMNRLTWHTAVEFCSRINYCLASAKTLAAGTTAPSLNIE